MIGIGECHLIIHAGNILLVHKYHSCLLISFVPSSSVWHLHTCKHFHVCFWLFYLYAIEYFYIHVHLQINSFTKWFGIKDFFNEIYGNRWMTYQYFLIWLLILTSHIDFLVCRLPSLFCHIFCNTGDGLPFCTIIWGEWHLTVDLIGDQLTNMSMKEVGVKDTCLV